MKGTSKLRWPVPTYRNPWSGVSMWWKNESPGQVKLFSIITESPSTSWAVQMSRQMFQNFKRGLFSFKGWVYVLRKIGTNEIWPQRIEKLRKETQCASNSIGAFVIDALQDVPNHQSNSSERPVFTWNLPSGFR